MLTSNFYFLKKIPDCNISRDIEKICTQLEGIENELKENNDIKKENLATIRNIYEHILHLIYAKEKIIGNNTQEKFSNFRAMYFQTLTAPERLAFSSIFQACSTLGSHFEGDLFLPKFVLIQQFYNLWIILKFFVNKILNIKIDNTKFDNFYEHHEVVADSVVNRKLISSIEANVVPDSDAKLIPICDLLAIKERVYTIPIYQRGYKWDPINIDMFLTDIKESLNKKKTHYFGVIAAKKIQNNIISSNKDIIKILDGQQRLTTSLLFICACRDIFIFRGKKISEIETLKKYFVGRDLSTYIKNPGGTEDLNLEFQNILNGKYKINTLSLSVKKTKYAENYDQIFSFLKNIDDDEILDLLSSFESYFKVSLISFDGQYFSTKNEMEIFENINSKGKSLTPFEMIKNYIFNLCQESYLNNNELEITAEFNRRIFNLINRSEDNFINFVESLIHYFTGDDIKGKGDEKTRKTLSLFKQIIDKHFLGKVKDELNKDGYIKLLSFLRRYLKAWTLILDDKNIDSCDQNNNLNIGFVISLILRKKRTPLYPLIFLIYDLFNINDVNDFVLQKKIKDDFVTIFIRLINPLIKHFIIAGQGDSTINTIYYEEIKKIIDESKPIGEHKIIIEKLNSLAKNINERISGNFKLRLETHNDDGWVIKFLLSEYEWHTMNYPKSNETILRTDPTIEHIMPQTINDEWKKDISIWNNIKGDEVEEKYQKFLNQIGNFTLLSRSKNSAQQNFIFTKKIEILKDKCTNSPLFFNANEKIDISRKNKWTFKNIEDRTNELIQKLTELINEFK